MATVILSALIFGIAFFYTWGVAPCWQFEKKWKERFGTEPEDEKLIDVGLVPKARRVASGVVFLTIALIVIVFSWLFTSRSIFELLVGALAGGVVGALGAYLLHRFGAGSRKVARFFERM